MARQRSYSNDCNQVESRGILCVVISMRKSIMAAHFPQPLKINKHLLICMAMDGWMESWSFSTCCKTNWFRFKWHGRQRVFTDSVNKSQIDAFFRLKSKLYVVQLHPVGCCWVGGRQNECLSPFQALQSALLRNNGSINFSSSTHFLPRQVYYRLSICLASTT